MGISNKIHYLTLLTKNEPTELRKLNYISANRNDCTIYRTGEVRLSEKHNASVLSIFKI